MTDNQTETTEIVNIERGFVEAQADTAKTQVNAAKAQADTAGMQADPAGYETAVAADATAAEPQEAAGIERAEATGENADEVPGETAEASEEAAEEADEAFEETAEAVDFEQAPQEPEPGYFERLYDKMTAPLEFRYGAGVDVLLIVMMIAVSLVLRIPGFSVPGDTEEDKAQYITEEGVPFLFDMDSYCYIDRAESYAEGTGGKLVQMRTDNPMQSTISSVDDVEIMGGFPALFALLWRVFHIFSDVSVYKFITYAGPAVSVLSCIPAYLFVRKRAGRAGAVAAGFAASCAPSYVTHTSFGAFDTDILLFILPLIVFCAFAESCEEADRKKQAVWILLSSAAYAYLIVSWTTYSVYYFLGAGLFAAVAFFSLIRVRFRLGKLTELTEFRGAGLCFASYTVLTLLIRGNIDTSVIDSVIAVFTGQTAFSAGEYPSQGRFVTELKNASLLPEELINIFDVSRNTIVTRLGSPCILVFAAAAVFFLIFLTVRSFIKEKKQGDFYISAVVFPLWLMAGAAAVMAGTRFVQIPAIPLSILAGLGVGFIHKIYKGQKAEFLSVLAAAAVALPLLIGTWFLADSANPSADAALEDGSLWIAENTEESAVICSWWDLGYFYEYKADRRTVADGSVFNGRSFYWFGNAMLTEDPDLCVGIFRMLQNSGTDASYLADSLTGSAADGCLLLKTILPMEKNEARAVLEKEYGLPDEESSKLLAMTHPDEVPQLVIVVSDDMRRKIKAISYYGNWDFSGEDLSVTSVPKKSMLYRFYNNTSDTVGDLVCLYENTDPIEKFAVRVWALQEDI